MGKGLQSRWSFNSISDRVHFVRHYAMAGCAHRNARRSPAGYSLLEVADRLGHASPQTTAAFYQHLFASEIRRLYLTGPDEVHERLEKLREAELLGKDMRWA